MKDYSLYLFDLDGLLINSEDIYFEGWKVALERRGLDIDEAMLQGFSGHSASKTRKEFIEKYGDPSLYDEIYHIRERYIYECLKNGRLHLLPNVKESLEWLRSNGKRCVLVTGSWRQRVETMMDTLGLAPYFEFYICNEDIKHSKPDPEGYLLALEKTGVPKTEAIVYEDSNPGCIAAKRAGLRVVQVPSQKLDHYEGDRVENVLSVL